MTTLQDKAQVGVDEVKQDSRQVESCMDGKIFVSIDPDLELSPIEAEKSLGHRFMRRLREDQAKRTLLVDVASGRQWTGEQMYDKAMSIACALLDVFDLKRGTVVCIDYDHSDLAAIVALGVITAGGVVACAYPLDPYAELLYLSRRCDPEFLFCHKINAHWGRKLAVDLEHRVATILMDEDGPEPGFPVTYLKELLEYDYKNSKSLSRVPVACENVKTDLALITMSSGTTGKPKAVPATHWNCLTDYGSRFTKALDISFACTQSLDYVSGRIIMFGAIESGYRVIIIKTFEPETYCKAIQDFKIALVYLGASSFYKLITYPEIDKFDLSSLISVFPMGARITYLDELANFLQKHPNIVSIRQGYGASELSGGAMNSMSAEEFIKDPTNCGYLLPSVRAKIIDENTGELLGKNKLGLLHVSTPRMFPGYYDVSRTKNNNPDGSSSSPLIADSSIFDEDGFYKTGDLAYFNDKGQLFVIGRQKELMSCRGAKKVLPQELEELILEHPAVLEVCVLGIPSKHQMLLDCPRAFIVPREAYYKRSLDDLPKENNNSNNNNQEEPLKHQGVHKLTIMETNNRRQLAEDIMNFVDERIGWEKQLTGGIVILDSMGTTRCTGKIDKGYLRSLTKNEFEIYGDR